MCRVWHLYPPAPVGISASSGDHFSQWAGGRRWWQEDAGREEGVTARGVNTLVTVDVSAGV